MIALVALGNRIWGGGKYPHWIGALFMAVGLWINQPWWSLPIFIGCVYAYRIWDDRAWIDLWTTKAWNPAIMRTMCCFVLATFEMLLHPHVYYLITAMIASVFIPVIYYLSSRQKVQTDFIGVSEVLSGLVFGIIGNMEWYNYIATHILRNT